MNVECEPCRFVFMFSNIFSFFFLLLVHQQSTCFLVVPASERKFFIQWILSTVTKGNDRRSYIKWRISLNCLLCLVNPLILKIYSSFFLQCKSSSRMFDYKWWSSRLVRVKLWMEISRLGFPFRALLMSSRDIFFVSFFFRISFETFLFFRYVFKLAIPNSTKNANYN